MVFVELLEKRGVAGKLDSHPADAHPLTRYLALLTRHVGQLVDLITGGVFSVSSVPDRAEGAANAVLGGLFRDTFGFRKLSVYATKKSRLVALDTLDGSKVWDRYVRHGDSPVNLSHLSVTRTTHSGLTPLVAIAGSVDVFDKERNATIIATMVATLNALDGSMIKKAIFKDKIIKIVDLPVDIPASSSSNFSLSSTIGLVTESESGEIGMRVWPDTGEALDAVKAVSDRLYFTLGDQAGSSRIKGYRVGVSDRDEDGGSEAAAAVPAAIVPHEIWSVDISEGELIVSVADRVPTDRVASLGRVLGDRSVLYKYLNPHMKIVVASSPNNTGFTMYLIDQVSGHILHTARHTDGKVSADHPILAMQCENWIVYQYWKTEDPAVQAATAREQARQINAHAIVAMELYESNVKDERFDSDHFSSFDPILPYVVSKTYIIPEPITALGVTVTRNGVAVHDAVMALASGKLVTVSQMQLDPRRPLRAPTNEDKAENLAPYSPVIGFDPKHAVISHDRRVLGIGSINSSPAHLESTSIVAAFGLDVFGTRVAPSGTFDKLSASFSKANLVITMAALLAGSIVATTFVKRKRLSQSWK
ncbi:hypothetical protein EV182_004861 [Spiromyces aspiralis]|uniref:Uncharacterized protein n=1 Tax=Spiromyces aspiralis TaxID=68401 RepID=A0ACC1HE32_9FUNG|nr:hypothetical protein EV182_004861 [Spiromyces aspiralis]